MFIKYSSIGLILLWGTQHFFNQNQTYSFEEIESFTETVSYQTDTAAGPTWTVVTTNENHTIIIETSISMDFEGDSLQAGDYVGVFYEVGDSLKCAGKSAWTGENIGLTAYGDDTATPEKDGYEAGETFIWKVWRANNEVEYETTAAYKPTDFILTHTDTYATDGISAVLSLTGAISTDISLVEEFDVRLYPNPSTERAILSMTLESHAEVKVSLFDLSGKQLAEIQNGHMTPGTHTFQVPTRHLSAGLYQCQLIIDGKRENLPLSIVE